MNALLKTPMISLTALCTRKCPKLKRELIAYLMNKFTDFALSSHYHDTHVILDYDEVDAPLCVVNGNMSHVPCLKNQLGEADYAMWYHCVMSTSTNIIILGSDTDIWVYGMALKEAGWLQNKRMFVERSIKTDNN